MPRWHIHLYAYALHLYVDTGSFLIILGYVLIKLDAKMNQSVKLYRQTTAMLIILILLFQYGCTNNEKLNKYLKVGGAVALANKQEKEGSSSKDKEVSKERSPSSEISNRQASETNKNPSSKIPKKNTGSSNVKLSSIEKKTDK